MKRAKSGYLPSLDGWRALAVLGVLMTHDLPITIGRFSDASFKDYGGFGVYLFFAISGILICTRILEEESLEGRFHLKSFYVRRVFRIQPASLAYLATIAALMLAGIIHESWHYWRGALLFYANFLFRVSDHTGLGDFTGHFWTLSVEEHFYVLLSLLLFFVRKHRIKVFGCLVLAIWLGERIGLHHHYFSLDVSDRRTYWVIDYLLTPSLLALLLRRPRIREFVQRYLHPWVAYLVTLLLMLGERLIKLPPSSRFWTIRIIGEQCPYLFFGFSLWVIASMLHPKSLTTRFLELAPLKYIGRLSYSLYLWHVLFFAPAFPGVRVTSHVLRFLSQWPWKYLASFAAAMASYYLIEKPLIRFGHRLAPPATPGHRDLEVRPNPEPVESPAAEAI